MAAIYGQLVSAQFEILASDPTAIIGRPYFNTATHKMKYHDGTAWQTVVDTVSLAALALVNPMTAAGDLIYGGVAGVVTVLHAGTADQVLITGSTPAWGKLADANIASAAAIAVNKLAAQTASRAAAYDASGFLQAATTTLAELNFVAGVSSAIQSQLNAKQATGSYITALTGDVTAAGPGSAAATIAAGAVTDSKVAAGIDAAKIGGGAVSNAEFAFLDGVTSAIQTQLGTKAATVTTTKGDMIVRSSTVDTRFPVGADGTSPVADSAQTLGVKWATIAGGLTAVSKTANYTAANNEMVECDTTGGAFTLTLPSGTTAAVVGLLDSGPGFATNNLIVAPATGQSIDTGAANDTITMDVNRSNAIFYRASGATVWEVQFQALTLYTPGFVPGSTTGVAPTTGNIGEKLSASLSNVTMGDVAGTAKTVGTLVLTAGNWMVYGKLCMAPAGTTCTYVDVSISATTNTHDTTEIVRTPGIGTNGIAAGTHVAAQPKFISTAGQSMFLVSDVLGSGTVPATIASSMEFFAIRIA